jgi:hypothetical protein
MNSNIIQFCSIIIIIMLLSFLSWASVRRSCRPQLRTHVAIVVSVVDADAGAESVVDADSDAVAAIAYAVAVVVVAITTSSHHFKRQSWR